MKLNIRKITITIVGVLFLSACGGGNSKTVSQDKSISHDKNAPTTLQKGDKVVATSDNAQVVVNHNENGEKTVYIKSGEAVIR